MQKQKLKEGTLLKVRAAGEEGLSSMGLILDDFGGEEGPRLVTCESGIQQLWNTGIQGSYGYAPFLDMISIATKQVGTRQALDEIGGFLIPVSRLTWRVRQSQSLDYNRQDLVFIVSEAFEKQPGDEEFVFGRFGALTKQVRGVGMWDVQLHQGLTATLSADTFANMHYRP